MSIDSCKEKGPLDWEGGVGVGEGEGEVGRGEREKHYFAFLSNPDVSSMNTDRYFPMSSL